MEHILDDLILKKPGLVATTLSGASASQMAEYILMMLLALGHHMSEIVANQNRREWPGDRWNRFRPLELHHNTVRYESRTLSRQPTPLKPKSTGTWVTNCER